MNNESKGGTKSHTGDHAVVLSRSAQMAQAKKCLSNRTSSRYTGTNKAYGPEGCSGYGSNEKIKGYSH